MAISSCNKEVATRLFKMLAVNELEATTVKHDHASYAKLGLLTQQAQLLQQQAVLVVNKCAQQASNDDVVTSLECTAVSKEYDDGAKRLLGMLSVNDKTISTLKRDQSACAKLSLLADQVDLLQYQAQQVVEDATLNHRLIEISKRSVCRLVPGTTYYHYTQNSKEVLSRVSSQEWNNYDEYHGSYLYDFDFAFRRLDDQESRERTGVDACGLALIPSAMAIPTTPPSVTEDISMPETIASTLPGIGKPTPVCPVLSRW